MTSDSTQSEKSLAEMTVQDIYLELIRRTQFNEFDGEKVYGSLMLHRDLWQAVIMESAFGAGMEPAGLMKLRDISQDFWHVDTLYILTADSATAHKFVEIIEAEGWAEEITIYDDEEDVQEAFGDSGAQGAIISIWWD